MLSIRRTLAALALGALALSGCNPAPAPTPVPTARPTPVPTVAAPSATPVVTEAPVTTPAPALAPLDNLRALLTTATFVCDASDGGYDCSAPDGTGNTYRVVAVGDGSGGFESFAIEVSRNAGPASEIDITAASTYLGTIADIVTGAKDSAAFLSDNLAHPGSGREVGDFTTVTTMSDAATYGLRGELTARLAGRFARSADELIGALATGGYACEGPDADPKPGFARTACTKDEATITIVSGEDGAIYLVSAKADQTSKQSPSFGELIALSFGASDAKTLSDWLKEHVTTGGSTTVGDNTVELTGDSLVITTPDYASA